MTESTLAYRRRLHFKAAQNFLRQNPKRCKFSESHSVIFGSRDPILSGATNWRTSPDALALQQRRLAYSMLMNRVVYITFVWNQIKSAYHQRILSSYCHFTSENFVAEID